MKKDYTQEYINLLENTLDLINQKQAFMQKLINEVESIDRETYIFNVNKLTDLIETSRKR